MNHVTERSKEGAGKNLERGSKPTKRGKRNVKYNPVKKVHGAKTKRGKTQQTEHRQVGTSYFPGPIKFSKKKKTTKDREKSRVEMGPTDGGGPKWEQIGRRMELYPPGGEEGCGRSRIVGGDETLKWGGV